MLGKKILAGRIASRYSGQIAESAFLGRHGMMKRAAGFAGRHKVATGLVGGGLALGWGANMHAAYGNLPGPNISQRNQRNRTLRSIRSSGANGLSPRSMGGYA